MATKKQKRERAEAKHHQFMAELRAEGLAAIKSDRERREWKNRKDWQDSHDKDHNWKRLIPECPHCQDMKERQARRNKANKEKV